MADDLDALAQEYFDFQLSARPSRGHLMGNYQYADRYDDASRAGEDLGVAPAVENEHLAGDPVLGGQTLGGIASARSANERRIRASSSSPARLALS